MYLPALTDDELVDYLKYHDDSDAPLLEVLGRLDAALDTIDGLESDVEGLKGQLDEALDQLHELQRED